MISPRNNFIILFLLFYVSSHVFSEYPEIKSLKESDYIFKQVASDIASSYFFNSSGTGVLPVSIYRYKPKKNETLFMISSRLNLPYESISTLNRVSSVKDFQERKEIMIPNQPALFIPENPMSDIELLLSARHNNEMNPITVNTGSGTRDIFYYIPDGRFNNTERAFFLNTFFRFPIDKGRITSYYGQRLSPITGERAFHAGIDIAAPSGTPVFAAGKGVVTENGFNEILGNYIILKHPGTYKTVYGHLKKSFVVLGNSVNAGTVIGEVGSTGYSTGPHLHFEVRSNEKAEDPLILLHRKQ